MTVDIGSGVAVAADETAAVGWFPVDAPPEALAFPDHARAVLAALARRLG